ncbi:hypothetical protein KC992_01515 [Candidatus Saccharibacteria bacterium]|nr:hypothetical protein [Candidatus Saccharibacteria bacterium]MCA9328313.1 hypothetical protein [Candidatus Saccharibacteria bacterium]
MHPMNYRSSYEHQLELFGEIDTLPWRAIEPHVTPLPGQNAATRSFNEMIDFMPFYEMNEKGNFLVHDSVWGEEEIGTYEEDKVLLQLLHTPAMRRLMAIEQLTLPQGYETVPNTTMYKRFEHAWGSVVFVRKMIEKSPELMSLSGHEKMVLQLRTFLSDFGHTAFSHLGDWVKQGFGGPEDAHDQKEETYRLLELSGVAEVLFHNGYALDEVFFPNVGERGDWVERSGKQLCVDRVDFGVRQILRMFRDGYGDYRGIDLRELLRFDKFEVVKGQLVMNDWFAASIFARLYAEMVLEHWQEPLHRGNLALFSEITRETLVATDSVSNPVLNSQLLHPYDGLLSIDDDITSRDRMGRLQGHTFWRQTDFIMRNTGLERRLWFDDFRRSQLLEMIVGMPALAGKGEQQGIVWDPINTQGSDTRFNGTPPFVDVLEVTEDVRYGKIHPDLVTDDFLPTSDGLLVFLPHLKERWIDPEVIDRYDGEIKLLSQMGGFFDMFIGIVEKFQQRDFVINYSMRRDNAQDIVQTIKASRTRWQEAMKRPRIEDEHDYQSYIEHVGSRAIASAYPLQMLHPNIFD